MMQNTSLLTLCTNMESGKLLPPHLKAKILSFEETIPTPRRAVQVEAVIEFLTEAQPQQPLRAAIEFKSRLTPLILEGAIHQIVGICNELRANTKYADLYPMVAAPYISESIQRRCKELGVGYADLNGTLFLAHKGFYIDIVRPATEYKNPQGIKRIFSGRSRRVARVLLAKPFYPFRLEELSSETQLSMGLIFQVTKRLQEDGFLERTSKGRVLTKPRELLRSFAKELRTGALQSRQVFRGFSEMPPSQISEELIRICEMRQITYAFTLTSGLESYERNLREEVTAAYVNVHPEEIRDDLRVESVGKGANVILMRPTEQDNTEAGGVFYKTRRLINGLKGVNPIQLFLDFDLQGGRGEEQAEFLLEHVLGFRQ